MFAQIVNALPACQLSRNAHLGRFGSPLVVMADGEMGFFNRERNELHCAHSILELRGRVPLRPATTEEAREFYLDRAVSRQLRREAYERQEARGYTGD